MSVSASSNPAPVRLGQSVEVGIRQHPEVPARVGVATRFGREYGHDAVYVTNVEDPGEEKMFGQWVNLDAFEGRDPDSVFLARVVA